MTLTVTGDTGTGKTRSMRMISSLLRQVGVIGWAECGTWHRPPSITFVEWSRIAVEDRFDSDLFFQEATECDILFLDDIGSEVDRFKTSEPRERLRQLLGAREKKFSMITTNTKQSEWASKWDIRVEDRLLRGNAIIADLWGLPRFSET